MSKSKRPAKEKRRPTRRGQKSGGVVAENSSGVEKRVVERDGVEKGGLFAADSRWPLAVACLLLTLATLRPLAGHDLWWQAARGREVVRDWSQEPRPGGMLIDDAGQESDWLGGLPQFLLYQSLGFSGLFLGGVLVVVGLLLLSGIGLRTWSNGLELLLLLLLIGSLEPVLMLAGRGLDVLLFAAIWRVQQLGSGASDAEGMVDPVIVGGAGFPSRRQLAACVLVVAWANFGPLSIAALLLIPWRQFARQRKAVAIMTCLYLIALCLTPGTTEGLFDSLILMLPWMFESPWVLRETPWAPLSLSDLPSLSFASLGLVTLGRIGWRREWRQMAPAGLAAAIGLASQFAAPLMAVWLLLINCSSQSDEGAARSAANQEARSVGWGDALSWIGASAVAMLLAVGWQSQTRLGWGVAASLEPRLFAQATEGLPGGGALGWDERATGAIAWCGLRNVDTRQRALLAGRLPELRLVVEDVRAQRRNRYQRSDGSWGGWWLWMQSKPEPIRWLAVSANDTTMIEALEPSGFRPLAIDSPVIPYASSYEPRMASAILSCESVRQTVDRRDWTYQPPNHAGLLIDLGQAWSGDSGARIQQAGVFRAMGLTTAALRVLSPPHRSLRRAKAMCYLDLADQERRLTGSASAWTKAVLRQLDQPLLSDRPSQRFISKSPEERGRQGNQDARQAGDHDDEVETPILRSAITYVQYGAEGALEVLDGANTPQQRFAKARLYLELGRTNSAREQLQAILKEFPQDPIAAGAEDVLRSL